MEIAVLMASGIGTRMRPLTEKIPKPLIQVAGVPMIETVIAGLEFRGVSIIYVVVGYLGEQFNYLVHKYPNVRLINNLDFTKVNNISSIYYACGVMRDTNCFICEADLYVADQSIFKADLCQSCYYGKMVQGHSEDWVFDLDSENYISRVGKGGNDQYNMVGIAYFQKREVNLLIDAVQATYYTEGYEKLFWDEVVNEHLRQLKLRIHPVNEHQLVEIDTIEELEEANTNFHPFRKKKGIGIAMKKVYTCFCTSVIHEGHLNIIEEAKKYGKVIVGVLSDESMVRFDKFPVATLEERVEMVKNIEGVSDVIIQKDIMYDTVIRELQPDYVIHGDNWKEGPMQAIRNNVALLLSRYGGQIIEVPYTYNERVKHADACVREKLAMPEYRRKRLKQLLGLCPIVKAMEVHSGLTGLIVEKTIVENNGALDQFDAMWISSLCDSTAKGKPDIELVDMTSRFRTIDDVMEVTTKPIIFDGDTGGLTEHFVYTVRSLERMGVSAVIIEDKTGLKKNSLFGTEVVQELDSIEHFSEKIRAAKQVQLTDDFMIIARLEALILEKGQEEALKRARAFVEAGADGIMIHSRKKSPDEIFTFCDAFRSTDQETPIVVVPTSYNAVTEQELTKHGVNIVIYANQLTRSAFPAMEQTAKDILKYHRAKEVDDRLMPIKDIISLIDEL